VDKEKTIQDKIVCAITKSFYTHLLKKDSTVCSAFHKAREEIIKGFGNEGSKFKIECLNGHEPA
jgi:hypothetical protein